MLLLLAGLFLYPSLQGQLPGASLDVLHYQYSLWLHDDNDSIQGIAEIDFKALKADRTISLDLTSLDTAGRGMHVSRVEEDKQTLAFQHDHDRLNVSFNQDLAAGEIKKIIVYYSGIPADGLVIAVNKYHHRTFFGDNWPNRAHNWLPCVDLQADKASVDFLVTAPDHYQVISNGILTEQTNLEGHLRLTHYTERVPLPTKVMVIGVADFAVNYAAQVDCIPISSWVYPEDREKGFRDYALAKDILPFYIEHVGPYPYRKLANVQSKTRFGGMENASAIFYSEESVKGDGKVESLLAHEIAHQWFGNSATEQSFAHLWLSEGFATYMTLLYLENKYGPDTLAARLRADRRKVISFSKVRLTPVVDTSIHRNFMQLLNANSYEKGSWVLHMLRRKLGNKVFWQGIQTYYADYAGRNATTDDLRKTMESVSGQNLRPFFQQWLYTPGQPKLNIQWSYDTAAKRVDLRIEQMQPVLFDFPLQLMTTAGADVLSTSTQISDRVTNLKIQFPRKPKQILADPDTNLLFEAEIKEN
jgi:aminopeptidase N